MNSLPTVSVIIPTYNRKAWLVETLQSLAQQTWPADSFEVIVVDDGSKDGTEEIAEATFPFTLQYIWQTNQGDAEARNTGARHSQADILVFLDDDVLVEPDYLSYLIPEHIASKNRIIVGTEFLWLEDTNPLAQSSPRLEVPESELPLVELPFVDVCSNNMSIRREAYFAIGMMPSLDFPGSSIWCDVDLSYRAYQQGFQFLRSTKAICWHRDYVAKNLENSKRRMREAAYRAVVLFQKYPDLVPYLPMFYDKTPIMWGKDPLGLVLRKLARHTMSSQPALWSMEKLVAILEKRNPSSNFLHSLYIWIVGGYIYRGYREGLREFGLVRESQ